MGIGWTELIVIFCVILLFFGAKRIPEVARALGKATREFKNARDSVVDEVRESVAESEEKKKKKELPAEKKLPGYDKKDQ